MSDKHKNKIISYGAVGSGISLIGRAFAKGIVFILGVQSMGGFFMPLWTIPVHSLFYKKSETDSADSIMNRELYQHGGRFFAFVILLLLISLLGIIKALTVTLIISGLSAFLLNICIPALRKTELIEQQ